MTYEEVFEEAYESDEGIRAMVDAAQARELAAPPVLTEAEMDPELEAMWVEIGNAVERYRKER